MTTNSAAFEDGAVFLRCFVRLELMEAVRQREISSVMLLTSLEEAKDLKEKIGIEKGEKPGKHQMLSNFLNPGLLDDLTIPEIAKLTGLDKQEVALFLKNERP